MAGDWIKMRTDLAEDPAVIGIAGALDLDEDTVVGKLHRFWSWADRQTVDGNAPSVTHAWLDRYSGVTGFAAALVSVGWLEGSAGGGVRIPNFDRHNGKTAKQRALTALRAAKHKVKSNAPSVTSSVTKSLPEKRREEKRREEKMEVEEEEGFLVSWKEEVKTAHFLWRAYLAPRKKGHRIGEGGGSVDECQRANPEQRRLLFVLCRLALREDCVPAGSSPLTGPPIRRKWLEDGARTTADARKAGKHLDCPVRYLFGCVKRSAEACDIELGKLAAMIDVPEQLWNPPPEPEGSSDP